ncbi:MAG: RagB/SusD family nutrient uptake outer membrane protein [Bacteroidetes bacterium]|nr:MAG: RagB/SusD family nutrient uptake outer membrane protein [Bacteroidota bacterium]
MNLYNLSDMKKIYSIFIAIPLFLIGCTDLDDVLYDRIPEDAYTADPVLQMSPIYRPMQDHLDWGGWWFCQELSADGLAIPIRGEHWNDQGKWVALHKHDWDTETEAVQAMWGRYYEGIVEANKFIERQVDGIGDPVVDEAIAKAKILRAYYYYLVIDNYGDAPFVTIFVGAPERPFATPKAEIFDSIVKHIEESIPFLDEENRSKTAVTRPMAHALLAKLYLNAEVYTGTPQWSKAEEHIDAVLASGYTLELDALGPFVTNNQNSPENIWVIPYHEDTYHGFNLHMRTLHYLSNQTFNMPVGPWNGLAVVEDHLNTYAENDRRRDGFLIGQQFSAAGAPLALSTGEPVILDPFIPALEMLPGSYPAAVIELAGARVVKFEVKMGARAYLGNHFPIFRLADFYLMKAEVLIRQGQNGDSYVNIIRERAGLEPWSNVDLDMLLEERAREMFFEGHRRQDLIRFGKFGNTWWEKNASGPERQTYPIPQWVLESNPNLSN